MVICIPSKDVRMACISTDTGGALRLPHPMSSELHGSAGASDVSRILFGGGPAKENVIGIGMGMQVRLDDIYAGKGNHVVHIGKVVEITESAE